MILFLCLLVGVGCFFISRREMFPKLFFYIYFLNLADGSCEGVFCDPNADCRRVLPEGVKQCKCREGWQGDGRNCSGKMIPFV